MPGREPRILGDYGSSCPRGMKATTTSPREGPPTLVIAPDESAAKALLNTSEAGYPTWLDAYELPAVDKIAP